MKFQLRTVAGSTFRPKESPIPRLKAALQNAECMTPLEQANLARRLILNYEIDGQRIEDFIEEAGGRLARLDLALNVRLVTFHLQCQVMESFGIYLKAGAPYPDIEADAFGTVVDAKKLIRKFKKLRPLAAVLPGLALY